MIKLPNEIANEMSFYRAGLTSIPFSYIDFHCKLANEDMWKQDWKILEDHGLVHDGWCDEAKFKQLVVAYKNDRGDWEVATVRWHTSGAWFKKSAGWIRFKEAVAL